MTIDVAAAATELARRRRAGRRGPRLEPALRPLSIADAFAIQQRIATRMGSIGGWKCSLPAGDRLNAAPIFASTIVRGTRAAVAVRSATAQIEPEIAFVLARDLAPRDAPFTDADVTAAIGATHLVLELLGNRYDEPADVPPAEMLADCSNNQGLVVGPVVPRGLAEPLETIELAIDGPDGFRFRRLGRHPEGHPLRPLVWLANFQRARGESLTAGQIVTTGSYAGAIDVPLGTPLTIAFGPLGAMELTVDPAPSTAL